MTSFSDKERAWENGQEAAYNRKMEDADRESERLQDAIDKADSEIQGSPALLDESVSEYLCHKADSAAYEAWADALHDIYTNSYSANDKNFMLLVRIRRELDKAVNYYCGVLARKRIEDEDAKAMEP